MALIVEDGSIVTGANTWSSRADYIAFAASVGVVVADDDDADVELIKSCQFVGQHEASLKGDRVTRDQPTAYPRVGVVIDGWVWASDEIPRNAILCQLQTALDIRAGFDPWNPSVNPNLIKKRSRVEGAVEVEYAVGDSTGQKLSRTSTADALLNSLLCKSGLFSIPMERR